MNNFRFIFLRSEYVTKSQPIGCVAISVEKGKNRATYQVSVLNPVDVFDRGVARQLALGRLVEKPITVVLPVDATMHDITREVMLSVERNNTLPTRAQKSATKWLNAQLDRVYFDLTDSFFPNRSTGKAVKSMVD